MRRAPVQAERRDGESRSAGTISWEEHEEVWRAYAKRWGAGQSAERIAERHGFGRFEAIELLGRELDTFEPNPGKAGG